MLHKSPKQLISPIKVFLLSECGLLVGTILWFQQMRSSESTRHFIHKNYPSVLQSFYDLEEKIYNKSNRESDLKLWQQQQNEH